MRECTISFTVLFSALLLFIVMVIDLFNPENIVFLAVLLTSYSFSAIVPATFIFRRNYSDLTILDLSLTALFSSFLFISNYFAMVLPSIIYYIIPGASGLTFYLPIAIFYGAFKSICKNKGLTFLVLSVYGIISELFFPALFWFPYYLAWGGYLEIHYASCNLEEPCPRMLHGFLFGLYGAGLSFLYMLVAWGYYKPIFIALPAVLIDGFLSSIGFSIGYKMGENIPSLKF